MTAKPTTIDEYIATFPEKTQQLLNRIRVTIRKAAPKAEERISYGIAAFTLDEKILIYFAGFINHVSIYPKPRTPEWTRTLAQYKGGKGTIQFPMDKPLPVALIAKLVRFKVEENLRSKRKTKRAISSR